MGAQTPVNNQADAFFQVPRSSTQSSVSKVELPMMFYDVAVRQLNYWVEIERVLPKFEKTGLLPCRFFNGKALVSLIFYQYKQVSIGAYDEVTITILCHPQMLPKPRFFVPNLLRRHGKNWTIGAYVLEMPVTIPAARAAGRELWGFPKFETRISHRLEGRSFEFSVEDPGGGSIVRVRGKRKIGIPKRATDLVTYSNLNGQILRTVVDVDAKYMNARPGDIQIEVGPSDHGMVQNLRDLGLAELRPFLLQVTDQFRSRLNAGEQVAQWPTPPLAYPP